MGATHHTPEHLDSLRQTFGGRMSAGGIEFLRTVQVFIEDAIRAGLPFSPVVDSLRSDVNAIARHGFNLDAARSDGVLGATDPSRIESLRITNGSPMSEREIAFLRDLQGVIDYTVRNDLGFKLIVTTLGHDVNAIARYGFSLDAADAEFFEPKSSGYAGNHEDAVGEPDEIDE